MGKRSHFCFTLVELRAFQKKKKPVESDLAAEYQPRTIASAASEATLPPSEVFGPQPRPSERTSRHQTQVHNITSVHAASAAHFRILQGEEETDSDSKFSQILGAGLPSLVLISQMLLLRASLVKSQVLLSVKCKQATSFPLTDCSLTR